MRFELGLSRRAYAIRRGCNDKSVRKAIGTEKAHGRIWAVVLSVLMNRLPDLPQCCPFRL